MNAKDINRIVELNLDEFKQQTQTRSQDDFRGILTKLASIKKYYEKNLTIFKKHDKNGRVSYVYQDTEEKLKIVKEKGKFIFSKLETQQ
jgi:hypothetical protein